MCADVVDVIGFCCRGLSIDWKLLTEGLLENLNYISSKGFQITRRPNQIKYRRFEKKNHKFHYDVAFFV